MATEHINAYELFIIISRQLWRKFDLKYTKTICIKHNWGVKYAAYYISYIHSVELKTQKRFIVEINEI